MAISCSRNPSTRAYRSENWAAILGLNSIARLATQFIEHDFRGEEPVVETDLPQEPRGDRLGLLLKSFGEMTRIVPPHKRIGAGVHDRVPDRQAAEATLETVAVQTVLTASQAIIEHRAVGHACLNVCRLPHDLFERPAPQGGGLPHSSCLLNRVWSNRSC